MDDRQKIQDRLRKKEQEVQALEERLRTARTYVQALHDILKILDGEKAESASSVPTESILRAGSSVDRAKQAILKNGGPMHINPLAEAIGGDTSREGRISLASSLVAYVRKGKIFTRTAPNTFGLLELGHKTASDEEGGPPAGFGQMTPHPAARHPPNPRLSPSVGRVPTQAPEETPSEEGDDIPF
jgi:hypothetical protein